ncbi:MAG: hypothetical protein JOZ88_11960 [Hyphomicrobiales bacterium]|nr:hypothetical protein [Hyphomicrobiales bacterium]
MLLPTYDTVLAAKLIVAGLMPAALIGEVADVPIVGDEVIEGSGVEGEMTAGAGVEGVDASAACVGAPACELCVVSATCATSEWCGSSTRCEAAVCAPAASYMTRGSSGISPGRDWRLRFATPCFVPAGGFLRPVFT